MKAEKAANICFIAIFLVFIFAVSIFEIVKQKDTFSFYENRMLASEPQLTKSSLLSGSYFSGWESFLKDHATERTTLQRLSTSIDINVVKRPVVSGVVVTKDKLLGFNDFEKVDPGEIAKQAGEMTDSLSVLNNTIKSYGGVFYFVAVPGQYTYFSGDYPSYLNNRSAYTSAELSDFKADMAKRGVNLIDMGDIFSAMGNPPSMYSASDYHYSYYGAYETYRTVMDAINRGTNLGLSVLSAGSNMTIEELPNPYLGSRERKLCNVRRIGEKAAVGVLKTPVPFTRTDDGNPMPETVYSPPLNKWDSVSYGLYMGGDVAETVVKTDRPNLPSVLIYGDSFTNPIETLLYPSFNEMRSIDLRGYDKMSLQDYIRKYRPDVVIAVRDYEALLSTDGNGTVLKTNRGLADDN